jgi:hypothetical protein
MAIFADTWIEHTIGIHHRNDFARSTDCEHVLQDLQLQRNKTGSQLSGGFQAGALHEDPSPRHVHCPGAELGMMRQLLGLESCLLLHTLEKRENISEVKSEICKKLRGDMQQCWLYKSLFLLHFKYEQADDTVNLMQVVGAILNATVNLLTAWWMLETVPNICDVHNLPEGSPWTCPGGWLFYDASVIWGLVGPARIFGSEGIYSKLNWFFLGGALLPVPVWLLTRKFPKAKWLAMINVPIFIAAASEVPPASAVNLITWVLMGTIFNYFVFNYRRRWWQRYNYVLSAALDAGTAFMAVALYLALELHGRRLDWWGNQPDHCPLAHCPTAPGVEVEGCPVF